LLVIVIHNQTGKDKGSISLTCKSTGYRGIAFFRCPKIKAKV